MRESLPSAVMSNRRGVTDREVQAGRGEDQGASPLRYDGSYRGHCAGVLSADPQVRFLHLRCVLPRADRVHEEPV